MKATGVVRRIDDLNRIIIPKGIYRDLEIKPGALLEIFTTDEGILLKPYKPKLKSNAEIAEKWLIDYKDMMEIYSARFNIDGNIVTCEVIKDNERKTGMATCNSCDTFNPAIGMMLAFSRVLNLTLPFDLKL